MTINEYQKQAHSFACYKGLEQKDFSYSVLGLAEETGEVCGKFAKAIRDDDGIIEEWREDAIIKELGDVCWFVAEIATLLDVPLEDVMQGNIDKLTSRKKRNKIHGDGDDR